MSINWLLNVLLLVITISVHKLSHYGYALAADLSRGSFPNGFVFGTASSAYQYEGAVKEDNRGPCIWDKFAHTFGKISDFSNADIANDQYHSQRYQEDIELMKDMGMDAYRFSISWTRIFPNGTGQINQAGIEHYNNFINALLAKGIEPYVTIFHWDSPQALEDKYNGWLSPKMINDFANYAETLFENFGDRVKHWITLNEPHNFAYQGYDMGFAAPGRCSILLHLTCRAGNSATEPYIVAHHLLLAHATVVDIYRKRYKPTQGGSIGASLDVVWYEPATNSAKDIKATQRAMDFQLGWFLDPMMYGEYPYSMRERVGDRLPRFTAEESALLKGSLDFVGINHYTTYYVRDNNKIVDFVGKLVLKDTLSDSATIAFPLGQDGKLIGKKANSIWLYIVPWGMRRLMNYIKQRYGNPVVVITENGMDDPNIPFLPIGPSLRDKKRIRYHHDYLENLAAAINEDGCNVKGYFAWSLLDNWEWAAGYTSRFGLYYVDYKDNLKRYPKDSSRWFKNFLNSNS